MHFRAKEDNSGGFREHRWFVAIDERNLWANGVALDLPPTLACVLTALAGGLPLSTPTTTLPENCGGQGGAVPPHASGPACNKCLLAASRGSMGEGAGARDVPENYGVPGSNPGPAI